MGASCLRLNWRIASEQHTSELSGILYDTVIALIAGICARYIHFSIQQQRNCGAIAGCAPVIQGIQCGGASIEMGLNNRSTSFILGLHSRRKSCGCEFRRPAAGKLAAICPSDRAWLPSITANVAEAAPSMDVDIVRACVQPVLLLSQQSVAPTCVSPCCGINATTQRHCTSVWHQPAACTPASVTTRRCTGPAAVLPCHCTFTAVAAMPPCCCCCTSPAASATGCSSTLHVTSACGTAADARLQLCLAPSQQRFITSLHTEADAAG